MEQIVIIHPDGKTLPLFSKARVSCVSKATQKVALLSDDLVAISITTATPLDLQIEDYILVYGKRYKLNQLPNITKNGERSYTYEIEMEGAQYDLIDIAYQLPADAYGDTYYSDLAGHLNVLMFNINRVLPGKWILGSVPKDTAYKNIIATEKNCLAALQELCNEYGVEFEITSDGKTNTLNIKSQAGTTHPFTLKYGRGRGLYNLSRENISNTSIKTRLFVYGGTENLGSSYGNNKLCLPGTTRLTSYIEDTEAMAKYGVKEGEKNYSDIKPEREGVITAVGSDILTFSDGSMDFDLNEKKEDGSTIYLIDGTEAKVKFQTGQLAGYEFDVHSYDHSTKTFVINKFTDENGMVFPSEDSEAFRFANGDKYIITDINLPQSYRDDAEKRLLEAGTTDFSTLKQPQVAYKLSLDGNFIGNMYGDEVEIELFHVGDFIQIEDAEVNVNKAVRITRIERNLLEKHTYDITLSDTVSKSTSIRVINDIKDINDIISINKLADPAKARRRWKATQELISMVFDPEGDYYSDKIKPLSIETSMLSVGAKSTQFTLSNVTFQPNFNGDANTLFVSAGSLIHYAIEEQLRTWAMVGNTFSNLKADTAYYIYAKCPITTGIVGNFVLSVQAKTVTSEAGYYNFLIGVLNSVVTDSDGTRPGRLLSLTYGSSTINGRFIRTGQIESSDGTCVLDLDGNNLKMGDASCSLEWNKNNDRKLRLKGTLIQSPGGTESPLGVWCGSYVSTTIYYPGDEVSFTSNGVLSSFRRIGEGQTKEISPLNAAYWQLIAQGSYGTNGNWVSYVFKQSVDTPAPPTGTSSIPTGWEDAPKGTGKWWMSKATISGTTGLAGTWSTPIQVTAEDGVDGAYTDFKYKENTSLTDAPALSASSRNPTGWSDTPPILEIGQYLWFTQAQIDANNNLIGKWSTPVRISGEKGNQGDKGDQGEKGEPGKEGNDGAAIVFRGEYSSSKSYYGNLSRIDVVKYNSIYYKAKKTAGNFSNKLPTDTNYWENFGAQFESVATELLLAEYANIANFIFRNQRMESQGSTSGVANIILDGLRNVASFAAGKVKFENDKALIGWLQVVGKDLVGYDEDNKERIKITSSKLPSIASLVNWIVVNFKAGSSMPNVNFDQDDLERGSLYASCPGYRSEIRDPWNDRVDYEEENTFTCYIDFVIDEYYSEVVFDAQCGVRDAKIDSAECFLDVYAHNGTSYSTKVASGKFSDPINVMLNKGKYRALFTMYAHSSRDWRGEMYISMQGLLMRRRPEQTIIGKDGLLVTSNGNYLKMQSTDGFEVKIGNYGLRINALSGIQKTTNNGSSWSSL